MATEPTISTVTLKTIPIERPKFSPYVDYKQPLEEGPYLIDQLVEQPTAGEKLQAWWQATKILAGLTPYFVSFIYGLIMKSWKTTLGAIIAGLAGILGATGVVSIPVEVQNGILTIALFIIGFFAADDKPNA